MKKKEVVRPQYNKLRKMFPVTTYSVMAVFNAWVVELDNADTLEKQDEYYNNIYGFIWGLRASDMITESFRKRLSEEFTDLL